MNILRRVVIAALVAMCVAGCSTEASQPPPEQPNVSPSPTSMSSPKMVDLWVSWRAPDGKTGVDMNAVNAAYGLSKSWASTPEVAQRGYPIIGLSEDEGCVVLFSEYIGGEVTWPIKIVMLPRYQPVGTEPSDAISSEGASVDDAREKIAQMAKRLGCGTPASSYRTHERVTRIPNVLDDIQKRTALTRKLIFDILDTNSMFEKITINPQQVIDVVSNAVARAKSRVMVDGIKYEKTDESYAMELFDNPELEAYMYSEATKSGAVSVHDSDKTVYDHVTVDSEVELKFMQSLEDASNVKFYVKLPGWFKIDTPLGTYNPDWAIALEDERKIYFVAETKGSNDINDEHLGAGERGRILAARQHFAELGVPYAAPVSTLTSAMHKAEQ